MEEIKQFFFDTYALYAIFHETESYLPYIKNISIVTSILNLMELHYLLLRLYNKDKADLAFGYFKKFSVDFDDEIIKEANEFRLKHYRRDLSYVDCIGYILAKKLNALFLTGDEQFKDFDNVEFVK